jgi:hypothetical protein
MTTELLSALAGIVLSLLFSYVPGLSTWFAGQSEEKKKLLMLGLLVLTAAGVFGLGCTPYAADLGIPLTCDEAGVVALVKLVIAAAVANQTAYKLTPQTEKVKAAKASAL